CARGGFYDGYPWFAYW
nr:immunoglobulin heavy chain junction region [Mus musculus]